ncbi:MAG: deoxyribonuclease IV [Thermodesulfovibrionales bacterium]
MQRLGVHTSIAGGVHLSIERARALGANTLQIFSHSPRNWRRPEISYESVQRFKELRKIYEIEPVFVHSSYLINIASPDRNLRARSVKMLLWELEAAQILGADYLILHPGSSSIDVAEGRKRAKRVLREISEKGRWKVRLLLENTAGERGDISSTVEDLAELLEASQGIAGGICFDTCHAFQAGYELRKPEGIEKLVDKIHRFIGEDAVKLIHLNDSKKPLGFGVDRHEHIGKGKIGDEGFRILLSNPAFSNLPVILETPKKTERDDVMNLRRVQRILRQKRDADVSFLGTQVLK